MRLIAGYESVELLDGNASDCGIKELACAGRRWGNRRFVGPQAVGQPAMRAGVRGGLGACHREVES